MRLFKKKPSGHIIISGTGRAGTTFLIQYFTAVGMNTGYTLDESLSKTDPISNAGLERSFFEKDAPTVVKSPWLSDEIESVLGSGDFVIRNAIVPVRDLYSAAESRRRVYQEAAKAGKDPLKHPGTLWKTSVAEEQEAYLAIQFYKLIQPLVQHGVPITFLPFPDFVISHDVLFSIIRPILNDFGVNYNGSLKGFQLVADTSLLHNFNK